MFPAEFEKVVYFRRFPNNYDYASITSLFSDDNHHFGYFPSPLSERLEWQVRQEFASVAYGEPLECVHARRAAFGGEEIYIDADRVTPDRCLLFPDRSRAMRSHGHVQVRWWVPDVMETPRFCISSAMSDQCRLKWGLGPRYIEMLQAVTKLKPTVEQVRWKHRRDSDRCQAIGRCCHGHHGQSSAETGTPGSPVDRGRMPVPGQSTCSGLTRRCDGFYSAPDQTCASKNFACPINEPDRVHLDIPILHRGLVHSGRPPNNSIPMTGVP